MRKGATPNGIMSKIPRQDKLVTRLIHEEMNRAKKKINIRYISSQFYSCKESRMSEG